MRTTHFEEDERCNKAPPCYWPRCAPCLHHDRYTQVKAGKRTFVLSESSLSEAAHKLGLPLTNDTIQTLVDALVPVLERVK